MKEIVAVDIGGTHARFALAQVEGGRVVSLGEATTLKCAEHASLQLAWEAFGRVVGKPLPRAAGIAVACPIKGDILKLTNNPWVIQPAQLGAKLGIDEHVLVNDFGAVAHAVAQVGEESLQHVCGPDMPLPKEGIITIVGPGTGLGSAYVVRRKGGYFVCETEGGHIDFSPLDQFEDRILQLLRLRYRRVSVERVVSGPGLANLYEAIAEIGNLPVRTRDDKTLWTMALDGSDHVAGAALERFCLSLGTVAGDLALAQGGGSVVIAGGLGLRLAKHLGASGFAERFVAKGRFESLMAAMPVKLITYPQPGLLGAAAAFAEAYR
ncbi:glucokinase [Gluconacetobacter entanii]|uniref:Glucokinase n=1 Tax=Gluconacetobacter entanii TaxID=108528 RepID=A0A318PVH2_9PROT|nr:glucokinase [Gluconacetobacter entanii]MBE7619965.1 glucokinase [Komagataeibacter sp. FXV2]MCE2580022.1 glucokinase [Komagataeibacter sp. FNDCR1]MCW4592059.1 glucokinase [Gluconacetobacter entanii]MCW4595196.1 glucokinase [Gluconacetobacter entanii]NPC88893.1 glucokinase [Gluconacetobacter entanii]